MTEINGYKNFAHCTTDRKSAIEIRRELKISNKWDSVYYFRTHPISGMLKKSEKETEIEKLSENIQELIEESYLQCALKNHCYKCTLPNHCWREIEESR